MKLDHALFKSVVSALRSGAETGDHRALPRVGLTAEVILKRLDRVSGDKTLNVRVRDLSRSGLGFLHSKSIREGSRLLLQLPVPEGEPRCVLCRVRHCRNVGNKLFAIGAEFVDLDEGGNGEKEGDARSNARSRPADVERIRRAILD
jgi:hypothetical protein